MIELVYRCEVPYSQTVVLSQYFDLEHLEYVHPSRSAALVCGQVAKTPWALCEKAPLEAHPGLACQGELDTRDLSDDVVAPTALGSFIPIRAGFRLLVKHLLELNDTDLSLHLSLSPLKVVFRNYASLG